MAAPLEGIKVLDLSLGIFGPYCGMLLADMGADVIKVERPDVGEGMRYMYLSHIKTGVSTSFAGVNRGKRSLALDIRPPSGREIMLKLVSRSDVLISNFRPGVMERLGYGYEELSKLNPGLVMATLSAYGPTGPHAQLAGQDLLAQAYSGIIALQGYEGGDPQSVGAPIADGVAGITAAWGVMVALFARQQTGKGQEITSNLADALLALCPTDWADYLHTGELRKGGRGWYPNMPYGPWRTQDRDVVINLQGDFGWREFCTAMDLGDLRNDARFATNADRVAHREALEAILKPLFLERPAAEWKELFRAMGLRCDLVYNYRDLEEDPQTAINEMIVEQHHPAYGRVRTVGQAVKLRGTPGVARDAGHLPPPAFAEHTESILRDLGYDDERIAKLNAQRVVNTQGLPEDADLKSSTRTIARRPRMPSED